MKGACAVDFAELAKEEFIFPSVELEDNVSVIRFLASKLREKGVVKADFTDAVVEGKRVSDGFTGGRNKRRHTPHGR